MHPLSRLALILALLLGGAPLYAAPVPTVPSVAATSYVLMDAVTGTELAEGEADLQVEPASLTKMMTAYVVFKELEEGNISLRDQVRVSEKAWRMEGSKMFIEVDSRVSVEDLLKGMIVQSGNDASVALAEHVAGSEEAFAALMNHEAEALGLDGTHFVNATGLPDPAHYTTARDMAHLARALIRDYPKHYAWHAIKSFTYNKITQKNRNRLLWGDKGVDGIKTGHTQSAGYCLVASAKRGDMRLIAVVMGTESPKARGKEAEKLLGFGFRFYETHRLYLALKPLTQVRVWKGAVERVPVGVAEDLWVTVPRGSYDKLDVRVLPDRSLEAPVGARQPVGKVNVRLDGGAVAQAPLVALAGVGEGGLWQRLVDEVKLMFQ